MNKSDHLIIKTNYKHMRKIILTLIFLGCLTKNYAQSYDHVLNYSLSGSPVYGVKIKTNMPFTPASQMPTIHIQGYNYISNDPIDLLLTYYTYSDPADFNNPEKYFFRLPMLSSSGAYTPTIQLANEGGKVIIYINDRAYFQRFTVSVFSMGLSEASSWFQGWTAVDEPLTGTAVVEVPYRNRFKGDVILSGNGIWNSQGNVGIGTLTPKERLSVNGKIRAQELKVETANWPDYVFEKDYQLPTLEQTEKHIQEKGHLPGIPSAAEVKAEGIEVGDMNAKLLKKIEELTLYLIELKKEVKELTAKSN